MLGAPPAMVLISFCPLAAREQSINNITIGNRPDANTRVPPARATSASAMATPQQGKSLHGIPSRDPHQARTTASKVRP